jgi:hypothetical protein
MRTAKVVGSIDIGAPRDEVFDAELRGGWGKRLVRWLADRYFLRMTLEQCHAVIMVIALQGMALVSFVALGVGLAVASLF